jgi:hypothetical protein
MAPTAIITSLRWAPTYFSGFFSQKKSVRAKARSGIQRMDDASDNLLTINNAHNADIDHEEEESHQEGPPKLSEALDMVRKLHLLASPSTPSCIS